MIRGFLILTVLALGAGGAAAQDGPARTAGSSSAAGLQGQQIRLSLNMNLFVPDAWGLNEQGVKAQEQARRSVYELAVRECTVLRDSIASECRMESMNVNINRHQGQQPEGFTIGANASYRVILK